MGLWKKRSAGRRPGVIATNREDAGASIPVTNLFIERNPLYERGKRIENCGAQIFKPRGVLKWPGVWISMQFSSRLRNTPLLTLIRRCRFVLTFPSPEAVRKFLIKYIVQLFLPRGHKGTKIHEVQYYQLDDLCDPSGLRDFSRRDPLGSGWYQVI
jgi:hypothetical protein